MQSQMSMSRTSSKSAVSGSCKSQLRTPSVVHVSTTQFRTCASSQPSTSGRTQQSRSSSVSFVSRVVTHAAPSESKAAAAPAAVEKQEWVALLANADFWFNDVQNESVAEQLRERVRFFKEIGRPVDFYFVPEPAWLATKFPGQSAQVRRPCVALMSSDKLWITFMKLRLDRVLRVDLGDMPEAEALKAAGTIPETFSTDTKWTAPYGPYAPGWWNVFLPKV